MAKDSKEEIKALNYAVYQSNIFVAKEGSSVGELKLPHGLVVDVTNQNREPKIVPRYAYHKKVLNRRNFVLNKIVTINRTIRSLSKI